MNFVVSFFFFFFQNGNGSISSLAGFIREPGVDTVSGIIVGLSSLCDLIAFLPTQEAINLTQREVIWLK